MRPFAFGLLLLLGATTLAPAARADDAVVEAVHVRVAGPTGCTDERRFFDEVRSRSPRVRLAEPAEPGRTFEVRVDERGGTHIGTLVIVDGPVASAPRIVHASTCTDVVGALALVAALSVDASAGDSPLPAATTAPVPPPPPPPPAPPFPPKAGAQTEPTPVARTPLAPVVAPAPSPSRPSSQRVALPVLVNLALGGTVSAPDAASQSLGGRAFVESGPRWESAFAPTVRASFDLPTTRTIAPAAGVAKLTFIHGALEACLHGFSVLSARVHVGACAGGEGGALHAEPSAIANERPATRAWVAALGAVRATALLLPNLFVEADAGAAVPFVRDQFVFLPSTTVYQAPLASFRGFVGAGVHFP